MIINAQTKIAALLKQHPDALEAIVSLSPAFTKLRNPLLRKLMAGRTSIAMASGIAGCTPEAFFTRLAPLGFTVENETVASTGIKEIPKTVPSFMKTVSPSNIVTLDVRAYLAGGKDPLQLIQKQVRALPEGHVLKIINSFEPTPLMSLLEKQGFETYADTSTEGIVETYFFKSATLAPAAVEGTSGVAGDWEQLYTHFEKNMHRLDVRFMEMPIPMVTILEALDKLPGGDALYVHHKRVPVFLLQELKERDFDWRIREVNESELFLLIFRKKRE